jgi:hypothetical protein
MRIAQVAPLLTVYNADDLANSTLHELHEATPPKTAKQDWIHTPQTLRCI